VSDDCFACEELFQFHKISYSTFYQNLSDAEYVISESQCRNQSIYSNG